MQRRTGGMAATSFDHGPCRIEVLVRERQERSVTRASDNPLFRAMENLTFKEHVRAIHPA